MKEVQEEAYESRNSLYEVLEVSQTATQNEIRKAYHRSALRLHPDKNPGDEAAKVKFQQLQNVMDILGDPGKREVYDQTGSINAGAVLDSAVVQSLYKFLRTLFKQVTEEDVDEFSASYRGSKEEEKDLKIQYDKSKGDLTRVFNQMMCSDPKVDSHRFMDIIDAAISCGEVKEYNSYRKWATEVSKTSAPPNPLALPRKRKKNGESSSELAALINHRAKQQMDSLASLLAAKYEKKDKRGKRGNAEEQSQEDFLAAEQCHSKKTKNKPTTL